MQCEYTGGSTQDTTTPTDTLAFVLGDAARRAWLEHARDSWVSVGRAIVAELPRYQQAAAGPYTYASSQATACAGCGQHKHTPLRIDAMGGYVCLTCIDQKLGSLLGEFGYSPDVSASVDVESALDSGDPNWRTHCRPNLTGNEQLWYAVRDIAELRSFLAGERAPLPGSGLAVVRVASDLAQSAAERVCPNTLQICQCDKYAPCKAQQSNFVDPARQP